MIKFPKDFMWGAATSAYQVEGNNIHSDWWAWEKETGVSNISGDACRHYELYKEDFNLAKQLGHNAHRLSIEWSRIEQHKGQFSSKEIGHYCDVILSLRERNIEPIVTLHHFTNPLWFSKLGGWEGKRAYAHFLDYIRHIIDILCDKVTYWVTINEPNVYTYLSYILGIWPPQKKSFFRAQKVMHNLAVAHIQAHRLIHGIYKERGLPPPLVSIAHNLQAFIPCSPDFKNRFASFLRNMIFNFAFINRLAQYKSLDFIGINYYNRNLVEVERWHPKNLLFDVCKKNHHPVKRNSLGWDIYPQGLCALLLRASRYNLPVFILENGICTDDDRERWDFIRVHLENIHLAMMQGARVLGYIYWSLMDNYEWEKGFGPRFGLAGIDYNNYQRIPRESARKFAEVCRTGMLQAD